ncbi:unnamed protein product [Pseudo-nitzschia multistriata]|uniref:Uncharacterized protein n=1 Tax=Pseudo-nitzschia multistriata TaxID=183589 RepID=A0A448ZEJ6_9STRA|nr:unnamed protein product [Pseudo-nitzschia multistriata]
MDTLVLEDHVSVVSKVNVLGDDTHEGNHSQSSVVDFLVLVVNPSLVRVVDPVGGSQEIARYVSGAVLDLLREPLDGTAAQHELEPANGGEFLGGLKGVVAEGRVEGGVDSGGVEVPSEAGSHGDASVLELGLAVHVHGGIVLVLGKTDGVKETHGCGDSNHVLVLPGGQRRCLLLLLGRSKGGAGVRKEKRAKEKQPSKTMHG